MRRSCPVCGGHTPLNLREQRTPWTYECPNGHRWTASHDEGPRVSIVCPSCQRTAFRAETLTSDPSGQEQP